MRSTAAPGTTASTGDRNDLLEGSEGDDHPDGGPGNDHVDGGPGVDTCRPGPGKDTLLACQAVASRVRARGWRARSSRRGRRPGTPASGVARGPRAGQRISIGALALAPAHVTVTVPVPGRVALPIVQLHPTSPAASATFATRPCASLTVPAGVT